MPVRLAICEFPDRDLSLMQQIRGAVGPEYIYIYNILSLSFFLSLSTIRRTLAPFLTLLDIPNCSPRVKF